MGKRGLVLEGGAMRGMFTCGVLDVFLENDIEFDGAVGVSAGACFGCNIKSKQIGRAIRYNKKYCKDPRYSSIRNLITTGDFFGAKFCYETLPFELDIWDSKTFKENPMEFYVVCTDVYTGKAVYHKCTDGLREDIDYFRASASMPLVSKVVKIGDKRLLDGGVADSIPIKFIEKMGYDNNVVILTQPKGYVKKPNSMMPIARLMLHKYPGVVRAMERRHEDYNASLKYIEELEAAGKVFVIRPKEDLNISRVTKDPNELERVYQIGREAGMRALEHFGK